MSIIEIEYTPFETIYKRFFSKITEDMYMEITQTETEALLFELFENALPHFKFPRQDIEDYNEALETYNIELTKEEVNIIATYMVVNWLNQQLANVELVRLQYTGSDFKATSQANHIAKLIALKQNFLEEGHSLQDLYDRRRKNAKGQFRSAFGELMAPIEED